MRQGVRQGHPQEEAIGQIGLTTFDHLPVGKIIVILKKLQFEIDHRVISGSALVGTISIRHAVAETIKVDQFANPPKIMARGNNSIENL